MLSQYTISLPRMLEKKPCMVRLFSSCVKRVVMGEIKNLRNDVEFVDNITQNNYIV
jgi:hypothetical protein